MGRGEPCTQLDAVVVEIVSSVVAVSWLTLRYSGFPWPSGQTVMTRKPEYTFNAQTKNLQSKIDFYRLLPTKTAADPAPTCQRYLNAMLSPCAQTLTRPGLATLSQRLESAR